ncbi:MAG: DEAD/DEAH box helicase family protein [Acidobacteria bacterium]|nr:DEAD/DEAH box helicase family protein [Acidobacteriota bacterium]
MSLTAYHARYFAHELTKRSSSATIDSLTSALADAQVDLNPHQVEAALFAFRSPLSHGAILADEVGLGKTIEAGILLSQRWAERRRRLLVICPANLRKQWAQELADKFFLPTAILEAKTFNEEVKRGNLNPFDQPRIILCSFQFARTKDAYVRQTPWNLVVIDEAHRLRNVYKASNKIANAIKNAIADRQKVLLTATPLQNSQMELYGLVSFIDEFIFGDLRSFHSQFSRISTNDDYRALQERIRPVCQRTLRRQVLPYISYTNRRAVVQEFVPNEDEQRLYALVSDYLQSPRLYALPASQRQLMTLILRKLLASSTYAISDTLLGLANKLEEIETAQAALDALPANLDDNFEALPEIEDEWLEDDADGEARQANPVQALSPEQREELRQEKEKLREFHELAKGIQKNSKGEVLLTALRNGFEEARKARENQANASFQQKALIFTESRRTQEYLLRLLEDSEFAGKVVLFNGTNNDPQSAEIYRNWLHRYKGTDRITGSPTADKRAALVEYFRDEASIMIATEAAAEGINLQFCNLVINYDMPWNPQRIEQRIGRCHRYGQKYDVVVVNFLNRSNAADVRIYQILDQKFQLFNGVFGASDEVLGAVQSGVDFEKRIVGIYQQCRTPEQISFEFDKLQQDLETEVAEARAFAQEQLLNNFDQEVIEKVKVEARQARSRTEQLLWQVTQFSLQPYASFDDAAHSFVLETNPFGGAHIHNGPYRMGRNVEDANTYRIGHPLAQQVLQRCLASETPASEISFQLTKSGKKVSILHPHLGQSGWLVCSKFSVQSFEEEDRILLAAVSDDGCVLDDDACKRLFDLPAEVGETVLHVLVPALETQLQALQDKVLEEINQRNNEWLDQEIVKLDRWSEDKKLALEQEIKDLDQQIRDAKRASTAAMTLADKLVHQRILKAFQGTRNEKRKDLFAAQDEVEARRDGLISEIEARMTKEQQSEVIFTIRWSLE